MCAVLDMHIPHLLHPAATVAAQCVGGAAGEALGFGSLGMYAHLAGQQGAMAAQPVKACCFGVT